MEACLICAQHSSTKADQFILSDRRKGLVGSWRFVECNCCGAISMVPSPTDEQLTAYYAVYSKDDQIVLARGRGAHYPALRKLFHMLSGDVDPRDFVNVPSGARVLDYGCGQAGYLSDFHNRGVSISGADISESVVNACQRNGLDVRKVRDFEKIPFADEEFDIVYLMQVLEHLRNPHKFMVELSRIIKIDGVLYLAVPNVASIWRKVFGNKWVSGWFAPFHLFHYNRDVLGVLAGQHGFDVIESWSSTPESWFRLNLKACLYPKDNKLDRRKSWLDTKLVRCLLMLVLRVAELPVVERDCLVIKLKRR